MPDDMNATRAHYVHRMAQSRARLRDKQRDDLASQQRGAEANLRKAVLYFQPAGTQLPGPLFMNLKRWPWTPGRRPRLAPETTRIVLKWDPVCRWCGKVPSTTIDHIRPLRRGGSNRIDNLVGSCKDCNSVKSHFMVEEIGWKLRPRTKRRKK